MKQIPDAAVRAAMEELRKGGGVEGMIAAALPYLPLGYEVKKLEWECFGNYGLEERVKTSIGYYSIHIDEDSAAGRMFCYFHLTEDGDCTKYGEEIYSGYGEYETIKAAAQADYESRVRECIVAKPVDVAAVRRQALEEAANIAKDWWHNPKQERPDMAIRAISDEPAQGEQWSEDMGAAPSDTIVLLAWWNTLISKWEYEAGLYHSTKGGWWHGSATHWMPLPSAPTPEAGK